MKLENMLNHSKYFMYNVSNRREIESFLGKIKHPKFVSALWNLPRPNKKKCVSHWKKESVPDLQYFPSESGKMTT